MRVLHRFLVRWAIAACSLVGFVHADDGETSTSKYFDQLRARGLYRLAEEYAADRLADPLLPPSRRIELAIEWSRTLVDHALAAGEADQAQLWTRAGEVLAEELTAAADEPRKIVLEIYASLVPAARIDDLVADLETSPLDESVRESLSQRIEETQKRIAATDRQLSEQIRAAEAKRAGPRPEITATELKRLQAVLKLKSAAVLQARARLSPPGSPDRRSDLIDADELLRKVSSAADDDLTTSAKLGQAIGNRLRDEYERAVEILDVIEKERSSFPGPQLDAIRIEKARVLLHGRQPDDALKFLHRMQADRPRLPGDYWVVYMQSLSALRRIAAGKNASREVTELSDLMTAALAKVDEQSGGSWSRRCRAVLSTSQSVEKYGPRLAAALRRAESEYLAGRIEPAIESYSTAAELARENGVANVEVDVVYALAALLAKARRWEDVRQRVRALVKAYPQHAKSPEVNLLALYAAGNLYDSDRTAERRADYERELRGHRQRFPDSPTVSEAAFLEGQLEETSGNLSEAIAIYQQVKAGHVREAQALAGIGRCAVALLSHQRETGKRNPQLEQRALELVSAGLKQSPEDAAGWNDAQVEQAYHAVKVLLLIEPPRFAEAERRLAQLDAALVVRGEPTELRTEIARRTGMLRLIAEAGQGRLQNAEAWLKSLDAVEVRDQLAAVEELSQIEIASPEPSRRRLIELQLASAESLNSRRDQLTPAQQRRLDLALAPAYLATAQPTNAIAVYQRLFDGSAKDLEFTRQFGRLLSARTEPGCRKLARACWQRVEKSYRQGTPDWLAARARVIDGHLQLGERDEAQKLLKVTTLLYAKAINEAQLSEEYAELARSLK